MPRLMLSQTPSGKSGRQLRVHALEGRLYGLDEDYQGLECFWSPVSFRESAPVAGLNLEEPVTGAVLRSRM